MGKFQAVLAMAGLLLAGESDAHAATFNYSGTLSNTVFYRRPSYTDGNTLAFNCTICGYQSEAISISASGEYTFSNVSASFVNLIGILYSAQFYPALPLTNFDGPTSYSLYPNSISSATQVTLALTAGVQYYWVTSTDNGYFADNCQSTACTFNTSVTGPGAIDGSVPEPSTWAMLLVGLGMTGFVARRRQTVRVTYA